ncbi:MAG: beta-galactosidase, partial [Sediminibacterium sp.]
MKNLTWLLVCCLISSTAAASISNPSQPSSSPEPTNILLRIGWEFCQPNEHTFDWSFIDGQLQSARNQGKKITLQIDPISGMPEWIRETSSPSDPQGSHHMNSNRLLTVWTSFIQ